MKIQIINLGRNNINMTAEFKNEKALHKEIGRHLLSRNWEIESSETEDTYHVYAGFRNVGTLKVLEP